VILLLQEEERVALLEGLKKKWEAVNKQYQTCTHIVTLDTIGKVRRYVMFIHLHPFNLVVLFMVGWLIGMMVVGMDE
jgi:hypothetical protein